jgi:hypothetical protein
MGIRLRFSLRTMFLASTAVAGICYWFVLPTVNATRFVRAVESADYKLADDCFREFDHRFLVTWKNIFWSMEADAHMVPLSFRQLIRGERHVNVSVEHSGPDGTSTASVIAKRSGLEAPNINFTKIGLPRQLARRIAR